MKFTLSWLHQHLRTQSSVADICQKLNQIGLEVESIEQLGEELQPFLTARINSTKPHPGADRLQICDVDAGPTCQHLQVVCGAANAREGLNVVFAPVGAVIPQTGMKIKKGKIRGQVSEGMLCSLEELGQAVKSDGIAELPQGTLPGESYADFLDIDDVVIDISITPNRGDALSIRGIARDLHAAGMGQLIPWLSGTETGHFKSPITWDLQCKEACPWVLGRVIKNVHNQSSPDWIKKRLEAIGLKPINFLVDLTNYFCFDLGRPFHVFDVDKIAGKTLTIRRGQNEEFCALNGKKYKAGHNDCVISDENGVQSLGGIIGGQSTGVSENTKDVFVECALFDPIMIAQTARRLSISTDASARFERGVDLALPPSALQAFTEMVVKYGGGEPSEVVSAGHEPHWQRQTRLHFSAIKNIGGSDLSSQKAVHYLEALGFEVVRQTEHYVDVRVPSWRNDVAQKPILALKKPLGEAQEKLLRSQVAHIDGERDLLEEILRLDGLDKIHSEVLPPLHGKTVAPFNDQLKRYMGVRRFIASRGYMEIVGFSFISQKLGQFFGDIPKELQILNPIASDQALMRPTALINLLMAAQYNDDHGRPSGALFEIGPRFTQSGQETLLCGLKYGHTPRYPGKPAKLYSWLDAKEDVLESLNFVGVRPQAVKITRDVPSYYHPGRSGALSLHKGKVVAYFGELHPKIAQAIDSELRPAIFEIFLENISYTKKKKKVSLSVLQPVSRDFSFLFPDEGEIGTLLSKISQAERSLITYVKLFDIYKGEHVPQNYRSVSIAVTLQPQNKNLTDKDIEHVSEKILAKAKECGATLRV